MIKIERIFSVFEEKFDYNFNFAGEVHNFWECVFVAKGSACVSADCRVYNLSEGEIIFHKPLELHKFFIDCKKGAKLYIFSFAASGELTEKIANLVCKTTDFQKEILDSLYNYLREKYAKTEINSNHKKDEFLKYFPLLKNPIIAQTVSTYISQLILSVSENSSLSTPASNYDTEIFRKAIEQLNDNINTSLSVCQLSKTLNISESTLKRVFKKYADVSIHKYFLMLKIQKATLLLEEGLSVCEVSERLGFSSQAYFSVCFKRETGKNPSNV